MQEILSQIKKLFQFNLQQINNLQQKITQKMHFLQEKIENLTQSLILLNSNESQNNHQNIQTANQNHTETSHKQMKTNTEAQSNAQCNFFQPNQAVEANVNVPSFTDILQEFEIETPNTLHFHLKKVLTRLHVDLAAQLDRSLCEQMCFPPSLQQDYFQVLSSAKKVVASMKKKLQDSFEIQFHTQYEQMPTQIQNWVDKSNQKIIIQMKELKKNNDKKQLQLRLMRQENDKLVMTVASLKKLIMHISDIWSELKDNQDELADAFDLYSKLTNDPQGEKILNYLQKYRNIRSNLGY